MKTKVVAAVFIGLFFVAALAWADTGQHYLKFQIKTHDEVYQLTDLISIANVQGLTVFAFATDQEFAKFKTLGYSYQELPSPGSLSNPRMSGTVDGVIADWDAYPTYQAYLDMMNAFATSHPNLCTIVNIGSTVQGRQLLFAKLSANVNVEENEPEVMYSSSMHGNETAGYVLMLRLIDYLLTNYGTDPQVTRLLDSTEVWINPLANPDGTYHGGNNSVSGAWRYNANGVDLNRNFPDPAAGNHPDGNSWQLETQAMMNLFAAHKFAISANFHGGVEVVNYPWDTWSRLHADNTWYINISRAYADSVHAHAPSGYMTYLNNGITNGYAWYRVTGGRQDFMTYFKGGREVTIELSDDYILPAAQLPAYWDYNKVSFLNYLENALYGIRGTVTDVSTGAPLPAVVTVLSHDIDSARVFTDPAVGDYHRMLAAGTYNLSFASPGYVTQTVNNVSVTNHHSTYVNVQMTPTAVYPDLVYLSKDAGVVLAGDSVLMHIVLKNNGIGVAQNAVGVLSCSDSYISISQNNSGYPSIAPGAIGISLANYQFTVFPACPLNHSASFRLSLSADGGYVDSSFFMIVIGRQQEDFERGDFASYPWLTGGNAGWVIDQTSPYEGLYSAKSGVITDNQSSELSTSMTVTAGTISFYYKVSSESGYDYLRFYIDNNLQAQWSGDAGWAQANYGVTAGEHTFKWGYYKDQGTSRGSDCAWVDYIIFPQIAPLQILTDSLPDWTVGRLYSQQLLVSGGIGSKTWSDLTGGLAGTGLSLSQTGLISGMPANPGQINFTAHVIDQARGLAQRPFTFTINPMLTITSDSLPDGIVDSPYLIQLLATGGTGVRNWVDRDNDLAGTGLSLSSDGLLQGTPGVLGNISFTALISDAIGDSSSHDYSFDVLGGINYVPGDANNSGTATGLDVIYLVIFFKGGNPPPYSINCPPHGQLYAAGDANGTCSVSGLDVTFMVRFFKGGQALRFCPDCPPALDKAGNRIGRETVK
ncbi:MAG TPA: hypothetical protein DCZ43_02565 [candidate division Zixibacteria bacterium]|nr:hypothetical protein [candidate division Zixibacteria bacterium]